MVQMKFIVWLIAGILGLVLMVYLYTLFTGRMVCDINDPHNPCWFGITEKARFLRYATCAMEKCAWGCGDERLEDLKLELDGEPKTCADTCGDDRLGCSRFTPDKCTEHEGCTLKTGAPHGPKSGERWCEGNIKKCGKENDLKYELIEPEIILTSSRKVKDTKGEVKDEKGDIENFKFGDIKWYCEGIIPENCFACPLHVDQYKIGALLEGEDECGEGESYPGTITFQRDYAKEFCSYYNASKVITTSPGDEFLIQGCRMEQYDQLLKKKNTFLIFAQKGEELIPYCGYRAYVCRGESMREPCECNADNTGCKDSWCSGCAICGENGICKDGAWSKRECQGDLDCRSYCYDKCECETGDREIANCTCNGERCEATCCNVISSCKDYPSSSCDNDPCGVGSSVVGCGGCKLNDKNECGCISGLGYVEETCEEKEANAYCEIAGCSATPPPENPLGIYCSPPIKELVDGCVYSFSNREYRFRCLVDYAYSNFLDHYDGTLECLCIGKLGWGPQDFLECVMGEKTLCPNGCGTCADIKVALYSMLITCGEKCGVTTDNLLVVGGAIGTIEDPGLHGWLAYNHPTYGWVFMDPTNPSLTNRLDGMFEQPENYPCIYLVSPAVNIDGDKALPFSNDRCKNNGGECI